MFSVRQKREISEAIQKILRDTNHPELPDDEIGFSLHVSGKEEWSWADIRNNGSIINPDVNPHNEKQDEYKSAKCSLKDCKENAYCVIFENDTKIYLCIGCKSKYDNAIKDIIEKNKIAITSRLTEKGISVGFNMDKIK